jgi:hypothetical protein
MIDGANEGKKEYCTVKRDWARPLRERGDKWDWKKEVGSDQRCGSPDVLRRGWRISLEYLRMDQVEPIFL